MHKNHNFEEYSLTNHVPPRIHENNLKEIINYEQYDSYSIDTTKSQNSSFLNAKTQPS